jgi:putative NADPH-quinone reductase
MKAALLVVANPSPGSFSHAMADVAAEVLRKYSLARRDLYAEGFDPVRDTPVEAHCRELAAAELILVFHPNWWGQPPAILKGWIDRVFVQGVAYDYPAGAGPEAPAIGLLRARAALVFNTSNTYAEREAAVFGNPLEGLWKRCVFGLCGVTGFERRVFGPVASSTPAQRAAWLAEVGDVVARHA